MKVIIIIVIVFAVALLAIYINNRIQIKKEAELKVPIGELVEVDGHNMSVYVEGSGDKTIL